MSAFSTPRPIDRASRQIASRRVRYRLLRLHTSVRGEYRYFISVRLGPERCTLALPTTDGEQAHAFYRAIRDGLVTPCTLPEVVADLA